MNRREKAKQYLDKKLMPKNAEFLMKKHKAFSWLIFEFENHLHGEEITQSRFRELVRMAIQDYVFEQTKELEYKLIEAENWLKLKGEFIKEKGLDDEWFEWYREYRDVTSN